MSLDLTAHFSRFLGADPDRLHLAAHSHHYWPDASEQGHHRAWSDAATYADQKWATVFGEVVPAVQRGIAGRLSLPDPETIAFAPNTHEFVKRLLSCFPADRPGAIGPDLGALAASVPDPETFIVVDAYHGFMAVPTDLSAVAGRIFYLAGGYKYAMSGEGCCFLHCPPGYGERPRNTGWYAAFSALERADGGVPYSTDGNRFFGSTFDPSGLYRMRAVFDWMDGIGLTVPTIHTHVLGLQERFLEGLAATGTAPLTDARLVTPVGAGVERGHFLTFETSQAAGLHRRLLDANLVTDVRGDRLRFGFACYHTGDTVDRALARIARTLAAAG